jgi:hypothetical protein
MQRTRAVAATNFIFDLGDRLERRRLGSITIRHITRQMWRTIARRSIRASTIRASTEQLPLRAVKEILKVARDEVRCELAD